MACAGGGLATLVVFFVVPMFFMGVVSLETGSLEEGFTYYGIGRS